MFSLLFFSIAYLFNWFPQLFTVNDYTQTFTSISMSIGILIGAIGLKKVINSQIKLLPYEFIRIKSTRTKPSKWKF